MREQVNAAIASNLVSQRKAAKNKKLVLCVSAGSFESLVSNFFKHATVGLIFFLC